MTRGKRKSKNPLSLLLVEGYTDEVFYNLIKKKFLADCRITLFNIKGLYNVNNDIIDKILDFCQNHNDEKIRVYCCLDRESRYGQTPGFDLEVIRKYIKGKANNVLSIDTIIATQQIESWFFYDIEGIYKFLKVPRTKRKPKRYQPPEKFGHKELQKLFENYGNSYNKGKRCAGFINQLDIKKIISNCQELKKGIELIKSQATYTHHK